MAETTTTNFIIAEYLLNNPEMLTKVLLFQSPKTSEHVYAVKINSVVTIFNQEEDDEEE